MAVLRGTIGGPGAVNPAGVVCSFYAVRDG